MSINFYVNGVVNDPPVYSTFINTMRTGNGKRKSHLASSATSAFQKLVGATRATRDLG